MSNSQFSAVKFFDFIYRTRTALNFGALFSDGTEDYVSPCQPKSGDDVTIREIELCQFDGCLGLSERRLGSREMIALFLNDVILHGACLLDLRIARFGTQIGRVDLVVLLACDGFLCKQLLVTFVLAGEVLHVDARLLDACLGDGHGAGGSADRRTGSFRLLLGAGKVGLRLC